MGQGPGPRPIGPIHLMMNLSVEIINFVFGRSCLARLHGRPWALALAVGLIMTGFPMRDPGPLSTDQRGPGPLSI